MRTCDAYGMRLALDSDLEQIVNIWYENISDRYRIDEDELDRYETTLRELFSSRKNFHNFWVAVSRVDDRIAGWQSYFPLFSTPLLKDHIVESSTYLCYQHRSKGLGYQLMSFALQQLKSSGIKMVIGIIAADNLSAVNLVKKLGFENIGSMPAIKNLSTHQYDKVIVGLHLQR